MATRSRVPGINSDRGGVIEEKITKAPGETIIKRYTRGKYLGKGGFAKVYEVTIPESRKKVAAKIISKASLAKNRAKEKLMAEIKIHRSMRHESIVNFEHFFEDHENVYILLELCPNQTLSELLRRRKRLTEVEVQCYGLQILSALKYFRQQKIIHRDLKIGNLFLSDKMEIKVGDFGLAAKLENDNEKRTTICGTPNYIAPEIIENQQGHSYEVDVWSYGVILYTLVIGSPPFEAADVKTTYRRIRMGAYSFPDHAPCSDQVKSLINSILVLEPEGRATLDEIQNHEFFNMNTIPKLLPPSTLACPPSTSYLRQYQPQSSGNNLTVQKDLGIGRLRASPTPMTPLDPINQIWVQKWVDYSSKYGLGYVLSNGAVGVVFNDTTKILLDKDSQEFRYITRSGDSISDDIQIYFLDEYPSNLQKKVIILQHFKDYLINKSEKEEHTQTSQSAYIKKWQKTSKAIMFRLSNKLIQVVFNDKTELVLSTKSKIVTYVDAQGDRVTYQLLSALESNEPDLVKRLRYTKELLTSSLRRSSTRKSLV